MPAIERRAEPLQPRTGDRNAGAQLAAGNLCPGDAEHGALVSIVRSAASNCLGAGGAQHRALLTGIEGTAADGLGPFGSDDGAALAGSL